MSGIGDGAGRLGERLLREVEVGDLSSVLKSVRELGLKKDESITNQPSLQQGPFNIPGLILAQPSLPILELVSQPRTHHPSGAGKTSLLYLLITHAILPSVSPSSILIGGQGAAIILFDPLNHFSVSRLVQVMLHHLHSRYRATGRTRTQDTTTTKLELKKIVQESLPHLHIFRPHSWPELIRALRSLPTYLFDPAAHHSTQRCIHALVLEDIDAFNWELRKPSSSTSTSTTTNPLTAASSQLTTALLNLSSLLSCSIILSSTSTSTSSTALRPLLPTSWPQGVLPTRIGVRRVEVLKFAPGMSVEEAETEREQRREVVARGRFEWWKVGSGREGEGGVFRVGEWGVELKGNEDGRKRNG